MARNVLILMRANPSRGHRKGWAMKIDTILDPEMAASEISWPTHDSGPRDGFARIKIILCSYWYGGSGTKCIYFVPLIPAPHIRNQQDIKCMRCKKTSMFSFSGREPLYFIEKTLRASYDRDTQIIDYMD